MNMQPHQTPAEIAYQFMKREAKAMQARDLIDTVIRYMGMDVEDIRVKAKVYTSINLDPRLAFLGKGIWGIRDWSPKAIEEATSMPDLLPGEGSYQPKAGDYQYLWDDEDADDDDEEEEPPANSEEDPENPAGK
ncbi:MAG: DNA-directed RNA polymerase subunit delta [Symbiobacteriaceae bacterium]|nr:DNA-directed RNA polymerase subunit delta [Symbiobacteriaceae bacterium]